jgi:hypothetical protein
MFRPIARFFLANVLLFLLFPPSGLAAQPRAVYHGETPPEGFEVLDRRGDRWLITGTEAALAALPGATLLDEPSSRVPRRTFTPSRSPLVENLVAQVNADQLIAEVDWLVGLGTRFSQMPNINVVADSLEARLASFGLATEKHYFPMGSLSVPNVIATKVGTLAPDSVFVICAHYDAISETPQTSTPGADDNGTGTVTLLTAARLLAPLVTDYTIKFVFFAGEEQGMVGSNHWVADMAAAGLPILGALNFDMMGWWTPGVPFDLEIETNEHSLWLADAICWAADTYTTMPYILHVDNSAWWGDFYRFWQNGFAAVNHEESWDWGDPDFNPNYHTTDDTSDQLSPEFFEGSARIGVAALASLVGVAEASPVISAPSGSARLAAGPNPFNGRVVLRLSAPATRGTVPVGIYDVRGQKVGSLNLAIHEGHGQVTWDGRDTAGRMVPGGVYLAVAASLPGRPSCRVVFVP